MMKYCVILLCPIQEKNPPFVQHLQPVGAAPCPIHCLAALLNKQIIYCNAYA